MTQPQPLFIIDINIDVIQNEKISIFNEEEITEKVSKLFKTYQITHPIVKRNLFDRIQKYFDLLKSKQFFQNPINKEQFHNQNELTPKSNQNSQKKKSKILKPSKSQKKVIKKFQLQTNSNQNLIASHYPDSNQNLQNNNHLQKSKEIIYSQVSDEGDDYNNKQLKKMPTFRSKKNLRSISGRKTHEQTTNIYSQIPANLSKTMTESSNNKDSNLIYSSNIANEDNIYHQYAHPNQFINSYNSVRNLPNQHIQKDLYNHPPHMIQSGLQKKKKKKLKNISVAAISNVNLTRIVENRPIIYFLIMISQIKLKNLQMRSKHT